MKLRKELLRLIDRGTTRMEMATVARISNPTIGRFIDGSGLDFHAALLLIRHYFPENELELVTDYCSQLQYKNARIALEYAFISGYRQLAEQLIQTLKESTNRHDRVAANTYELELRRNNELIEPKELQQTLEGATYETLELKIYGAILLAYSYYDQQEFRMTRSKLIEIEPQIELIHSQYLQESFKLRFGQLLSAIYLQMNNIEGSRKYSTLLSESMQDSPLVSSIFYTIGSSYMFEDPDLAIKYLKHSRDIYKQKERPQTQRMVEHTINFIQILHEKEPEYLQHTKQVNDIHALAFYHIKQGNHDEALKLLEEIELNGLPTFYKAFQYYYLGELTHEIDYYARSIIEFKQIGNAFYRQLPLDGLRRIGYPESILEALSIERG